jgi:uncharacterized protein YjdB
MNPTGYPDPVTITPTDTQHYPTLNGSATITLDPALPRAPGGGTAVSGSAIFTSTSTQTPKTLAGVTVTTRIKYLEGGIERDVAGTWAWVKPDTTGYASAGTYTEEAIFTPADMRVGSRNFQVSFEVVDLRTVIATPPLITPTSAAYGSALSGIEIDASDSVVNVDSSDGASEPIGGTWAWADPEARIDTKGSAHTADLVFTPDDSSYLPATTSVSIAVTPVDVVSVSPGKAPAIVFGEALSDSAIGSSDAFDNPNSGFVFSGIEGDDNIAGTLAWDDATIVPSGEPSSYNATFSPTGTWALVYNSFALAVPLSVLADSQALQGLEDALISGAVASGDEPSARQLLTSVLDEGAYANYDPTDVQALHDALDAAQQAADSLASGGPALSQAEVQALLDAIGRARLALVHRHPIVEAESDIRPVTTTGRSVAVSLVGTLGSVDEIALNGEQLVPESVSGDTATRILHRGTLAGPVVGTLSRSDAGQDTEGGEGGEGGAGGGLLPGPQSVIVTLDASFVDSLENGSYTIVLSFTDAAGSGSGSATFSIERPAPLTPPSITTAAQLPAAKAGAAYRAQLAATGSAPISWALAAGQTLPRGLTLSSAGLISGTPAQAGNYSFTIRATNGAGTASRAFSLAVSSVPTPTPPAPPTPPVPTPVVHSVSIEGISAGARLSYRLDAANSFQLAARVSVSGGASTLVTWAVTGPARIDASGKLTLTGKEGSVNVTARSAADSSKSSALSVSVVRRVSSFAAPLTTVNLKVKGSYALKVSPMDGRKTTTSKLSYSSSNKRVATVDSKGRVRGVKAGKATITVKAAGGKSVKVSVRVAAATPKKVTSFSVSGLPSTMRTGISAAYRLRLAPATASPAFKVSVSNARVLRVSAAGTVTALKAGTATVTFKAGTKSVKRTIVVSNATSLTTPLKTVYVKKGGRLALGVAVLDGKKAISERPSFASSNKKVATVNARGQLSARALGTTTVTAKAGTKSVRIKVIVIAGTPKRPTKLAVTGLPSSLKVGSGASYALRLTPAKNVSPAFSVRSSAPKVLSVSASGTVKALKAGTAKLTFKAGTKTVTKTIRVTK